MADGLRQSVLPAVTGGAAQRQLKATLHALGRLQRSWDRWPAYLAEDNADVRRTLESVLPDLQAAAPASAASLAAIARQLETQAPGPAVQVRGVNDPALAAACVLNEALHAVLASLEEWLRTPDQGAPAAREHALQILGELYGRMAERELRAWAVQAEND
ncbi:hypothetical protein Bxe_C0283 [Paraburkholderia xenovorans LB400]|uniref:Uncharacterized protein n=2 Tax=Paraburkholderia xenovorans TaxID=36873 RepID=Q13I83_PARXL|nr:hypothetical protein Bxe_C0283 [Paraburkholderia xenovorans LB400]